MPKLNQEGLRGKRLGAGSSRLLVNDQEAFFLWLRQGSQIRGAAGEEVMAMGADGSSPEDGSVPIWFSRWRLELGFGTRAHGSDGPQRGVLSP